MVSKSGGEVGSLSEKYGTMQAPWKVKHQSDEISTSISACHIFAPAAG